jgi:hypothetical protein
MKLEEKEKQEHDADQEEYSDQNYPEGIISCVLALSR